MLKARFKPGERWLKGNQYLHIEKKVFLQPSCSFDDPRNYLPTIPVLSARGYQIKILDCILNGIANDGFAKWWNVAAECVDVKEYSQPLGNLLVSSSDYLRGWRGTTIWYFSDVKIVFRELAKIKKLRKTGACLFVFVYISSLANHYHVTSLEIEWSNLPPH